MKFVGFGELLVRLNPEGYYKFPQANCFNVGYTGAEANIAVSLSYMGVPSSFVTELPKNEIADCAIRRLMMYGVQTNDIIRKGERIGVYYLEKGASQRPSKIVYDRKYSAVSQSKREDYDWDAIMNGATWFHFTGITVGLSPNMADICKDACIAAHKAGATVSCDLNYRKNLWTPEQAQTTMKSLMQHVDVLIGNEEDTEKVLGIKADDSDITGGKLSIAGYEKVARQLVDVYGFKAVATTLRGSVSASINEWSALLYKDGEFRTSKNYTIQLVDRVGGGDSFSAGLIYGFMNGYSNQKALEFATAASCLKQTMEQDFNLASVEDVLNLVNGNGSGRVQR